MPFTSGGDDDGATMAQGVARGAAAAGLYSSARLFQRAPRARLAVPDRFETHKSLVNPLLI